MTIKQFTKDFVNNNILTTTTYSKKFDNNVLNTLIILKTIIDIIILKSFNKRFNMIRFNDVIFASYFYIKFIVLFKYLTLYYISNFELYFYYLIKYFIV